MLILPSIFISDTMFKKSYLSFISVFVLFIFYSTFLNISSKLAKAFCLLHLLFPSFLALFYWLIFPLVLDHISNFLNAWNFFQFDNKCYFYISGCWILLNSFKEHWSLFWQAVMQIEKFYIFKSYLYAILRNTQGIFNIEIIYLYSMAIAFWDLCIWRGLTTLVSRKTIYSRLYLSFRKWAAFCSPLIISSSLWRSNSYKPTPISSQRFQETPLKIFKTLFFSLWNSLF